MSRALWINPLLVLAGCGIGLLSGKLMSISLPVREMIVAGMICSVAAEIGVIPLMLAGSGDVAGVSQAGLLGSLVHLLISISLAAVAFFAMRPGQSFIYWLLGFYWLTLIGLVIAFVGAVRQAEAPAAGSK